MNHGESVLARTVLIRDPPGPAASARTVGEVSWEAATAWFMCGVATDSARVKNTLGARWRSPLALLPGFYVAADFLSRWRGAAVDAKQGVESGVPTLKKLIYEY